MIDKLRDQIIRELAAHSVGVLTLATPAGPLAMPVRYQPRGLEVDCLLPRWSDVAYHLEQPGPVMLVVLVPPGDEQRWLRYEGVCQPPAGTDDLYQAVTIRPVRIDLIDQRKGWGARETLEFTH